MMISRAARNPSTVRSKRPRSFHAKTRRNARDEDPFIAHIHAGQNIFCC